MGISQISSLIPHCCRFWPSGELHSPSKGTEPNSAEHLPHSILKGRKLGIWVSLREIYMGVLGVSPPPPAVAAVLPLVAATPPPASYPTSIHLQLAVDRLLFHASVN